jgi:carbon storage regulator
MTRRNTGRSTGGSISSSLRGYRTPPRQNRNPRHLRRAADVESRAHKETIMLVLARKSNELIRIGDHITVKVISIRNGQVKLGIDAPRELRVTRDARRDDDRPDAANTDVPQADDRR